MTDTTDPSGGKASEVDPTGTGLTDLVEVARGGFGVVYRATQPDLHRTVALKVITGRLDDDGRMRFDRERQAMGSLSSHPNIVTVYGSGFTGDGRPFIVMEYMTGGSLADRLETGPLPWPDAVHIGVKLAGALEAAHAAGVLHRDLKPENALVSAYGEPQLADFGIARLAGGPETRSGVFTGSVTHAAPELFEGERATAASDVYSLASTVYALIAGQAPFVRPSDESILPVIARIASDPVPDLRPDGVPDSVCQVLEDAMAKDPAQRIGSAGELRRRLDAAQTGRTSAETVAEAPPPSPAASPPRPRRRRRRSVVIGAIAAGVLVVAAALGGVALLGGGQDKGRSRATPTTPPRLSKAEFIRKADDVCMAASQRQREAPSPNPGGSPLAAEADVLGRLIPILQDQVNELERLRPPRSDEDDVSRLIESLKGQVVQLGAARAAAFAMDQAAFDAAMQKATDEFFAAGGAASAYGLQVCGSASD